MLVPILIAVVIYYLYTFYFIERKKYPPGPLPVPGFGNLLAVGDDFSQNGHIKVQKWVKEYGKVFTLWMPRPTVLICDKEEYFIKQGEVFAGRPDLFVNRLLFGGNYGLIFNENDMYKQQRRFVLQVLRNFGMGKSILQDAIHVESRRLVNLFASVKNAPTDPSAFLTTAVGNIVHKLVFGTVREHDDPFIHKFKRDLMGVLEEMESKYIMAMDNLPFLRHFEKFFDFGIQRLIEHNDGVIDQVRPEIERHKETINYEQEPRDYIDAFLMEMKKREATGLGSFIDLQLLIAIYDLFAAGTETTITMLCYGIHYLLNYPQVQDKVHEEIDRVIGREHEVAMADQTRLPYVSATIQEIQRLGNILPLNLQHVVLEDVDIQNYHIPKGTIVVPQFQAVHESADEFDSPMAFRPERFLTPEGGFFKDDRVTPFSIGKRACAGEGIARMELFMFFTTLLQHFSFEPEIEGEPPKLEYTQGLIRGTRPFKCMVHKRST
ncbi:hypothetical protein L596_010043 [Steinernema carpocapsae]|uniref:Cytochrome P450 n=1 Tax=Steinernema carpocapsae TaxID=34508 RepID=A0A4U5PIG6_STECR|nr:hypothetical protein L596_010043 [Steinernema carpocapsae]